MAAAVPIEVPAVSPTPPADVLVVDDNAGKRLAVRAMLAPLGYDVVEADSGRAALQAIERQNFAVILMDVGMPVLDGYETAGLIRRRTQSQSTPIIFLTAFRRDETETACGVRERRGGLHLHAGARRGAAREGLGLRPSLPAVRGAPESLASITALNIEMLSRLAAAAELRDDDTGQHTRRVGEMSVAIARVLGVPELDLGLIRLAAPLHDVGKIAVPDAILFKPGKLTQAEFEQMKTHATVGGQMLTGSAFALLERGRADRADPPREVGRQRLPRRAGRRGDPDGRAIVAVADVYDALTHVRPYKPAWSKPDAIAEITSHAGDHFDPAVVDAFVAELGGEVRSLA